MKVNSNKERKRGVSEKNLERNTNIDEFKLKVNII